MISQGLLDEAAALLDACSAGKPVGLVCFGLAQRGKTVVSEHRILPGDRTAIRAATVARAFALIRAAL